MKKILIFLIPVLLITSCGTNSSGKIDKSVATAKKTYPVNLMTVDPGHFHAALVQKIMYPQVSPEVHVYAPEGTDVRLHLGRIDAYNTRKDSPTAWKETVYTGPDFFDKMLNERPGNVVVLAGNNKLKAEYISRSIESGFNVLADKPMVISEKDFPVLSRDAACPGSRDPGGLVLCEDPDRPVRWQDPTA